MKEAVYKGVKEAIYRVGRRKSFALYIQMDNDDEDVLNALPGTNNVLHKPRALFWFEFMLFSSINSRFNSLLFLELGLKTSEIGIVLAIYSIFAMVTGPMWTLFADKIENPPLVLLICCIGATLSFLSYSFCNVFFQVVIVRATFSIFFPPLASLMDAIGLNAFTNEDDDISIKQAAYGKERLWGAVSWAITHILLGISMDLFHITSTILYAFSILNSILFITIILYTIFQKKHAITITNINEENDSIINEKNALAVISKDDDDDNNIDNNNNNDTKHFVNQHNNNVNLIDATKSILCKNIYSITFFMVVSIIGMGTSLVEGLVFLFFVHDLKATNTVCGISVLITVMFEVPIFYYSDFIVKKVSNQTLMGIAHIAYVCRVVGYTVIPNPWWLLVLEPLHGVTYACFQLSSVAIASKLANNKLQSTAQGLRSSFLNFGAFIGYVIGGIVMERFNSYILYRVMAGIVLLTLILYMISSYCFGNEEDGNISMHSKRNHTSMKHVAFITLNSVGEEEDDDDQIAVKMGI